MSVRRPIVVMAVTLALADLTGVAGAGLVATPPAPSIPQMPTGPRTRCAMTGPAWSVWGVHTPNAPPRRGRQYLVTSWGIPCHQATTLVRAFFPHVPPHAIGKLSGAPKGFTCRGAASGLAKNRMYAGSCVRLSPAAMIDWEPTGGSVG